MKKIKLSLMGFLIFSNSLVQTASFITDVNRLRGYNGKSIKAFIAFVDLIDGAEDLIRNEYSDPLPGLQRLTEGVTSLVEARINDLPIDDSEYSNLVLIVNEFKEKISDLVYNQQVKSSLPDENSLELERKKLMEGLSAILYNAVYMLIDPKSMSSCLVNILNGIYKVVAAILADDKIDYRDWRVLLDALASIFKLSNNRLVLPGDNVLKS